MNLSRKEIFIYKCLSWIGFSLLMQRLKEHTLYHEKNMELYLRIAGRAMLLFIGFAMLPVGILGFIMELLENIHILYLCVNFFALAYVYCLGVFITHKLYVYAGKNLSDI